MSTSEAVTDKAARLLADGAVFVRLAQPGTVTAVVRGDTSVHDVDLHSGRWSCSCPSRVECSHLIAVMFVTVPARTR